MSPRDMPTAAQYVLLRAVGNGTYVPHDFRITTWTACQDRGWVADVWERRDGYRVLVATLTDTGEAALATLRRELGLRDVPPPARPS